MPHTFAEVLRRHVILDLDAPSYDNKTKEMLMEILDGNIDKYSNSNNNIALLYCAWYCRRVIKDHVLAEEYYLKAIEHNSLRAIGDLGSLYQEQRKLDLAVKYYIKAAVSNGERIEIIYDIIPTVSPELQLEILELVPQLRTVNKIIQIPPIVYFSFVDKKMKISRLLSKYFIDDIADICLSYY